MVVKFELPSAVVFVALSVSSMMAFSSGCTAQVNDTGPDSSADSSDTAGETGDPSVVWANLRIETAVTLNGVTADGESLYVAGTEGKLWKYTSLSEWSEIAVEVDDEDLKAIWSGGSGTGFIAVGSAGYIVDFNGTTLDVIDEGTSNFLDVTGIARNNVFAVSWGGPWHFDGKTWTNEVLPDANRLNALWCSADTVFGVGEDGAIEFRVGEKWASQLSPTTKPLHDVSGTSDSDVWAVGEEGTIIHWDGTYWADETPLNDEDKPYPTFWAVWAASPVSVFAVGNNGVALHYNGTDWTELPTGVDNVLYAIYGVSEDNVWATGNKGSVLHYGG
jgi:hypothetical protein